MVLAHPRNAAEKAWVKTVVANIKDRTYRSFWEDWGQKNETKLMNDTQAFKNRMYEIFTPEPTRYLLNQERSSFDPEDVLLNNKILLINVGGPSAKVSSVVGTMIMTEIWTKARQLQNENRAPKIPNMMFIDEFHQFAHLSEEVESIFREARKANLGLNVATQYIEGLPKVVQDAILTNARNKVIFQSSPNSARVHYSEFGNKNVQPEDFVNLPAYTILARLNTEKGISEPMTGHTYPAPGAPGALIRDSYNLGREIAALSRQTYGRSIADIERDDATRRIAQHPEPDQDSRPATARRKY